MKNLIPNFIKSQHIALSIIGLLALAAPPATALSLGVSPTRVELDINANKTRTYSVRVVNPSNKPIEVQALVRSWVMGKDNKLQVAPASEQSLSQWIVFTPSRFKVSPGGSQTVRFSVRPKVQPQPGEHRAVIYFQEVPAESKSNSVRVVGRLGVVIYGYVGDIKRAGLLNSVNVETKSNQIQAVFDISNQGNAHIRLNGQYAIWPAAKYPGAAATKPINNLQNSKSQLPENVLDAGTLPNTPVLPSDRRNINLPIPKTLPPGNYVLDINGSLADTQIQQGIPFTVTAAANESKPKPASNQLRNQLRNSPRRR
ncbi:MAG TPA: fimbria/pilus periplasmic chaperone [Nostocaceae cyanobacterium]|nr:fimbria/pilus periplasmic chaperone [Nostocaceae cyanobacterium]